MTAIQVILYLLIFMLGFFCGWHRRDGIASRSEMERKQKEAESRRVHRLLTTQKNLGGMAVNLLRSAFEGTFAEVHSYGGEKDGQPLSISVTGRTRGGIALIEVDAFRKKVRVHTETVCYQHFLSEASVFEATRNALGRVNKDAI